MRHNIFVFVVLLTFVCCKQNSNTVVPVATPKLSVNNIQDSILYTFIIPKAVFGIHDTLSATVTAYNQTAMPETLVVGPSSYSWFLQNNNGQTIMYGPRVWPWILWKQVIEGHESVEIYSIHREIADTSGQPIIAGPYSLHANIRGVPSFILNLSLQ